MKNLASDPLKSGSGSSSHQNYAMPLAAEDATLQEKDVKRFNTSVEKTQGYYKMESFLRELDDHISRNYLPISLTLRGNDEKDRRQGGTDPTGPALSVAGSTREPVQPAQPCGPPFEPIQTHQYPDLRETLDEAIYHMLQAHESGISVCHEPTMITVGKMTAHASQARKLLCSLPQSPITTSINEVVDFISHALTVVNRLQLTLTAPITRPTESSATRSSRELAHPLPRT